MKNKQKEWHPATKPLNVVLCSWTVAIDDIFLFNMPFLFKTCTNLRFRSEKAKV